MTRISTGSSGIVTGYCATLSVMRGTPGSTRLRCVRQFQLPSCEDV